MEHDDFSLDFIEEKKKIVDMTNVTNKEELCILFEQLSYVEGLNDIWITPDESIKIKIFGKPRSIEEVKPISEEVLRSWVADLIGKEGEQWSYDADTSFEVWDEAKVRRTRYRVNIYKQRGKVRVCTRLINNEIPSAERLGLPKVVINAATNYKDGLIFFTGVTGSGKSTSIASLLDLRARVKEEHIITLEDPIETEFTDSTSFFSQREKGPDFEEFPTALRAALRQAPDTILIGEIRDVETAEIALHAAETGHLVFATLHTRRAAQAVSRYALMFPPEQQGEIYKMLSDMLRIVVCQKLIPSVNGGRCALLEVLDNAEGSSIRSLLSQGKISAASNGMGNSADTESFVFEQHLKILFEEQKISPQVYKEVGEILKKKK